MGSTSTSSSYQKRWIGTVGLKNKLGIEIGGRTQVEHIERKKKKKTVNLRRWSLIRLQVLYHSHLSVSLSLSLALDISCDVYT